MSYERDEAVRLQEATEAMIQMREPRGSGPHPDPLAEYPLHVHELAEADANLRRLLDAGRRVIAAKEEVDAWMALGWPARTLVPEPNRQAAASAFAALKAAIAKVPQ